MSESFTITKGDVTQRDLAAICNVSVMTVSKALRGTGRLLWISVNVTTGFGIMFPVIGAQRRWPVRSYESGNFLSRLCVG